MNSTLQKTSTGIKIQVCFMRRSLLLLVLASTFFTMSAAANAGLNYSYYEGSWSAVPDFSSLTATKSGTATNIDLGIRNRDTYFSVLWQGYITIPADGTYTFELNSDDGSKLYLGNYNSASTPLINNDGLHGSKTITASQYLYKGVFPIAIAYLQGSGVNLMEFYWSSNTGVARQKVPDNVLLSNYSGTVSSYSGLNYSYVSGAYNALPDFFTQSKVKTGNSANIDLGIRNGNAQYAILWEGYITIPADGTYTFETNSDDGSKVYLGSYNNGLSPLVNNDGNHGAQIRKGIVYLSAGVYPIAITYYQNTGDQTMELYWSSNTGVSRQLVPDNAFKSTTTTTVSTPTTPVSTSGPINYSYYEGGYTSLPDVTSLTPVKTGTSSTFDLGVRNRDLQYVMMWQANITIPTLGLYTFETNSDDGSKLFLGAFNNSATPLVNNDGQHGTQSRSGTIQLTPGLYTMTIVYFQNTGGQVMEAYWSNTVGLARQLIPASVLSAVNAVVTPTLTTPTTPTTPTVSTPTTTTAPDLSGSTESAGLTGLHNYYFSSSMGDDSRTSVQAQNSSTPWKTLGKLNSLLPNLQTGDAVLLKRGDVFDGSINVTKSGVTLSAYGTGYKPVINGFTTLGNWVNLGGGVYSSYYPYNGSRINILAINGTEEEMGRYPNANDPKKGYLTYDSHTFNNSNLTGSITDNDFSSSVNWTGAELAIRKCRWIIDKCPITAQYGNTFYYNSPSAYYGIDGFGYFIQNHPKTLDQFGEWYYDPNSKNMQVYFGSYNPNNFTTKESVVDVLVSMIGVSNVTFDNLAFEGANTKAFEFGSCSNITISNSNITYTGKTGINANYTTGLNISNCIVRNTNNTAMYLGPSVSYSTVSNNKIINTGLFPGMGESNTDARSAFTIEGTNNTVQYNEIDSTGHAGIKFQGNNSTVKNNLVNYFCITSDDAAGIYTYDNGFTGRSILNNIVMNGVGASDGTNSYVDFAAQGIGLDDFTTNVEVSGNSIANCNGRGMGVHNSHEVIINGNTAYNNDMAQMEFDHDVIGPNDPIRNATMSNNIFVSKRADQDVFTIRTKDDDIGLFGYANNNYYARPIDDKLTFNMFTYFGTSGQIQKQYDLTHWKTSFGYDGNSYKSPVSIAPYAINSTSANTFVNGNFDSNIKNVLNASSDRSYTAYDNSVLDGGALKVAYTGGSSTIMAIWFYDPSANQTLLAGHTYRVKFSAKGNVDNNIDFLGTFQSASASVRSESKPFKIYNTRGEVELLFTPSVNIPSSYFAISTINANLCPVWWIDNLAIQEVYSISYTNPDDYLRFEYNASTSNKTVALDGVYSDMKNNTYNYSITLAPYTSAVLVRKGSSLVADVSKVLSDATVTGKTQTVTAEVASTEKVAAAAMDLKLTPNPAVNVIQLTLSVPQTDIRKGTLTIYSASGAAVSSKEISISNQPLTLDVSTFGKGVYTVNVVYGKNIISKKFVKL